MSINGTGGEQFRGFLIQARQMSNDANRVGSFATVGNMSRLSSCTPSTVSKLTQLHSAELHTHIAD